MNEQALELVRVPLRALARAVGWWSLGLAALIFVTVAVWPAFSGSSGISQAIDQLPGGVVDAFGLQDFGTPAGFLRGNLYEFLMPLLLVIAAVSFVGGQTAGEEAAGRLELYLTQPVSRRASFVGRELGAFLAVLILVVVATVVQVVSDAVFGLDIAADRLAATIAVSALLATCAGGLAAAISGLIGRPGIVLGVGIGVSLAAYLASALLPLSDVLGRFAGVSPWNWAMGGDPLVNATDPWRYLALGAVSVLLAAFGVWAIGRRDIAAA